MCHNHPIIKFVQGSSPFCSSITVRQFHQGATPVVKTHFVRSKIFFWQVDARTYYFFLYSHNLFLAFIVMYLTFISIRMSRLLLLLRLSSLKSPPNVTFKTSFSMAKTELPLRQSSLLCSRNVGLVMLTCTHFP